MKSTRLKLPYTLTVLSLCMSMCVHAETENPPTSASTVEKCAVLFPDAAGKIRSRVLPTLHVLLMEGSSTFALPLNAPANVQAIQCGRQSLVPVANDLKVITAGYPLAIVSGDRIGTLVAPDGRLRFNMLAGEMTADEVKEIGLFLDRSQLLLSADPAHPEVVDVYVAGNSTYTWQDQTYTLQDLSAALVTHAHSQTLKTINLHDGIKPSTVADVINVSILGKTFGIPAFFESSGKLRPIEFKTPTEK